MLRTAHATTRGATAAITSTLEESSTCIPCLEWGTLLGEGAFEYCSTEAGHRLPVAVTHQTLVQHGLSCAALR